jgi:hypothetical protein
MNYMSGVAGKTAWPRKIGSKPNWNLVRKCVRGKKLGPERNFANSPLKKLCGQQGEEQETLARRVSVQLADSPRETLLLSLAFLAQNKNLPASF